MFDINEKEPLTVSQITRQIKGVIENSFDRVYVTGEISNFKRHMPSGHAYFVLKDDSATLSAVMWRSRVNTLFFTPEDGMKVIARGGITVYPPRGNYQMDVIGLQPAGAGELQMAFEKLKQKLLEEGLFDSARKKPLPEYPARIGIVTSQSGAAFRDIVTVINRRFPGIELLLYPVRVQGAGASDEIAGAIYDLNGYGGVDLIITGRGGGSLEDLWAFNEENVARAIYDSKIPVISAVGHETDYSISDLVADMRAPTPSAAGELAVPERRELLEIIKKFAYNLYCHVFELLRKRRDTIQYLLKTYSFNRPYDLLRSFSQRVDDLDRQLKSNMSHRLEVTKTETNSLARRLESLSPDRVVKRGYAIVYHGKKILETGKETRKEGKGEIRFKDGTVGFTVRER